MHANGDDRSLEERKKSEYMCTLLQQQSFTQWAETKHKNLWLHYIIKWCALYSFFFFLVSVHVHSFRCGKGLHPVRVSYLRYRRRGQRLRLSKSKLIYNFLFSCVHSGGLLLSCFGFLLFRQTENEFVTLCLCCMSHEIKKK